MIAGLEDITEGEISIGGEIVNKIIAAERGVAMVFQSYALYPHMTVFDNMALLLNRLKLRSMKYKEELKRQRKFYKLKIYLKDFQSN